MPYLNDDPRLPFAAGSHTSYKAAEQAQRGHGEKTQRYLRVLQEFGPLSDFQAAELVGVPVQSICSIRNSVKAKLVRAGTTTGPYRNLQVQLWRLAE